MTVKERFALLKEYAGSRCPVFSGEPGCTLVFSVSDGTARATVRHVSAPTFDEAWRLGLIRIQNRMERDKLTGRHLRVDWVESSASVTWDEFQKRLAAVKRTYFRFGLAFDAKLTHLLTEMECHANAIFYGGADVFVGRFNPGNFARYAAARFAATVVPPSSPHTPVWLVSTGGAYCGPDGTLVPLPGPLPHVADSLSSGLYTGHRKIPRLTPEFLRQVVGMGSQWLCRQILPDGKFVYGYFPCFDREIASYNSLRHASSVYSLLDVVNFTGDSSLLEPAMRSLKFLAASQIREYEPEPGRRMAFLVDATTGEIKLGANGAALLAYAKHRELTGSQEFCELMELLAEGIAFLQNAESGVFTHVLDSETLAVKNEFRIIYYDGEAVFGLLRLYAQDNNPRWLSIARKAFDYFLGSRKHAQAHDHWLSYAANEIYAFIPDERYFSFGINNCLQYLDFILQRETTYPTLLELMMAAQKMLTKAQRMRHDHLVDLMDMDKFRRALHYRAHYLLNGFFWPELAMFYKNPDRITGAFFIRHHAFRTRIDDTQHYLSGLAAYGEMLDAGDPLWAAPEDARSMGTRFRKNTDTA